MPIFLVFAACAFASGFALRIVDPIVLPVALHFAVAPQTAAWLNSAFALPYAIAQPFLGPLGDRFGKTLCIQVCVSGLAVALVASLFAPSFASLLALRIVCGAFAGGLIPIVLASIGDAYAFADRQVAIARMLFAVVGGQMLGSVVAGLANARFGWLAAFVVAAAIACAAAALAWRGLPRGRPDAAAPQGFVALYASVFANPKAKWLYACVFVEGLCFYGLFPYMGQLLVALTGADPARISVEAGLVLGAFGIGGLAYAATVRLFMRALSVRSLCLVGSAASALAWASVAIVPVWWLDAAALFTVGVAFYMLHSSMQTEATELSTVARGSAFALFACGFFAGQGLGPIVGGALLHALGPRPTLIAIAVAIVVLGRVVAARVVSRPAAPGAAS